MSWGKRFEVVDWERHQAKVHPRFTDGTETSVALLSPHTKYRNVPTKGYASAKEAKRAEDLKMLFRAGAITDLTEQPEFLLIPPQDGERAVKYIADFSYYEGKERVVEDCKGMKTAEYIIKRKLMLFIHQIKIKET